MEHCEQFKIIHPTSGFKIDVMIPKDEAFNASRIARRRRLPVIGERSAWFAAPEDVILKKLQYYREGASDKHLRDIGSMLKVSGGEMDFAYLERWARELKVEDLWGLCRRRVGLMSRWS